MVGQPAPGLAGNPRPAESRVQLPHANGVGRPTCPRVRRPAESAAGKRNPFAIGVKLTPAVARSNWMDGLVFFRKLHLLTPGLGPLIPSVLDNSFLGVESQLSAAGLMFQDLAFAEFGRQGRSGNIYRAIENFHAKIVLVQVRAEFALAIRGHRRVSNLDAINISVDGLKADSGISFYRGRKVVLRHKVESGISLLKRHAVQLVALGVQRQLMEKQFGELT